MTDTVFILRAHAAEFVTREIGKRVREQFLAFEATVPPTELVTIDAAGVSLLTPSFVDEFFGRTASIHGLERFRKRFRIVGVESDSKLLINKVVRNRLMLDRAQGGATELQVGERRHPSDPATSADPGTCNIPPS